MPQEWAAFADRFLATSGVPNRPFGYFLAQTLVGTGPIERERMHAYAEKAMREASEGTTWTGSDPDFEAAVHAAVDPRTTTTALRAAWDELSDLVTGPGWSNALGQKLVQLTMPGVPDVYQGTELWEDSLVDPDNRRPVDFDRRRRMLADLSGPPPVDATGAAKLWVTIAALRTAARPAGAVHRLRALTATGPAADHLVGFERGGVADPGHPAARSAWPVPAAGATPRVDLGGSVVDILTDRRHEGRTAVADLLATYPVRPAGPPLSPLRVTSFFGLWAAMSLHTGDGCYLDVSRSR